jgi:hypothetical protein
LPLHFGAAVANTNMLRDIYTIPDGGLCAIVLWQWTLPLPLRTGVLIARRH